MVGMEEGESDMMRKQNLFIAYLLIGLGVYFLIKQLDLAIFRPFVGWPTILAIIGVSFLLHSYSTKDKQTIFIGVIFLGLGIHFHGLQHYDFWYNHWSVYTLIIGIAYFLRFIYTKKGLIPAVVLITISVIMIFSISLPEWFQGIYGIIDFIETFWPVILIAIGIYFIRKK